MQHIPNEDDDLLISGEVDDFAIEDDADPASGLAEDDQTAETKLIQDIRAYLKTAKAEHNTFDVLDIPNNATQEQKIAVFDMMAIHKGVTMHLRNIEAMINNKVRGS